MPQKIVWLFDLSAFVSKFLINYMFTKFPVLGPLSFLLYVYDLPDCLNNSMPAICLPSNSNSHFWRKRSYIYIGYIAITVKYFCDCNNDLYIINNGNFIKCFRVHTIIVNLTYSKVIYKLLLIIIIIIIIIFSVENFLFSYSLWFSKRTSKINSKY